MFYQRLAPLANGPGLQAHASMGPFTTLATHQQVPSTLIPARQNLPFIAGAHAEQVATSKGSKLIGLGLGKRQKGSTEGDRHK